MSTCEVANCTADAVATLAVYEGLAPQATVSPVLELCQLHSGVHLDVLEAYCREVGMPSAQHLVDSTPRHLGLSRFIEQQLSPRGGAKEAPAADSTP